MRPFVYWSGVYNAGLSLLLLCPPLYRVLGLNICAPIWGWLIAGFLGFTSAVLILAARDLRRRASLVYWEALLRYVAALWGYDVRLQEIDAGGRVLREHNAAAP